MNTKFCKHQDQVKDADTYADSGERVAFIRTKVSFTVTDFLAQVQRLELPHHKTPCTVKVREIVLNKVSGKNIRMIILASKWALMVTLNIVSIVSINQRSVEDRVMAICS